MRILSQDANLPVGNFFPFTDPVCRHQIECHLRIIEPSSGLCDFREQREKASVEDLWNEFEDLALDAVGVVTTSLYTSTIHL